MKVGMERNVPPNMYGEPLYSDYVTDYGSDLDVKPCRKYINVQFGYCLDILNIDILLTFNLV